MTSTQSQQRFLVVGGGPAGVAAATTAASLDFKVTLIENSVVGGAAHLWDCIPSKTMAATAIRADSIRNAAKFGLVADPGRINPAELAERIQTISRDIGDKLVALLESQEVDILRGFGRFTGPNSAVAETDDGDVPVSFDVALVSTGSGPRVPDWAEVDGERILTTRDAYDLPTIPDHLIVIGSGVTGVEFVHIFESLGSRVTLVVSRQQILPHRDAEVAAVLQEDFLDRGVKLVIGARAIGIEHTGDGVVVVCDDGRRVPGSHALLAIGSVPLTEGLGLDEAGVRTDHGYVPVDEHQRTSIPHIYAAGDCTGQMPLSSVASMQGRKIARHARGLPVKPIDYQKVTQAVFTQPEIASVGLEEVQAAQEGRKVRTTKVPFAANARSVLQGYTRGFVKVISDPATGVVLGGTIVGHRASELIGIIALAVQARVTVSVLVETLMVHPSLSESITDAAE
ncbi:MAG: NAD(P)H-quinone dehydrogenase [Acidimicrobiia bacterium]|nr:NAD(P)H-quinone dehydrogenase [Acidimicrobiia bacterium]MDH4308735.1 NAD(P)H-quinone dehydrogenase [Acidimicrobiia bacterium]MDH5293969.1 NAD(P)H-quinone dehydrogenase [Acidimicrobiia bacterium]